MAHIREVQRKDGTHYEVRYNAAKKGQRRLHRTKTFKGPGAKAVALRFKTKVEHDRNEGTLRDPMLGRVKGRELIDAWKESQAWAKLKVSTAARQEKIIEKYVLPRWADVQLASITRADADAWVGKLRKTKLPTKAGSPDRYLSPASVGKVYGVWRAALNHAVYLGWLPTNPAAGVPMPRIPEREHIYLTPEEVYALAGAVPPRFRALVLTAGVVGPRFGELAGLRRKRLDTLHGKLIVAESLSEVTGHGLVWSTPKNGKTRTLDLPEPLRDELDAHLRKFTQGGTGPDDLVFCGERGAPLDRHNFVRRYFRPAVKRALPADKHKLRFHDLRHTCASILISLDTHPKLISDLLGHSSIQITMDRYGHLLPEVRAEMSDRLGARMVEVERRGTPGAAAAD